MPDRNSDRHSYFLLYGFGVLFAILLCLVGSAMIMVASPTSSDYVINLMQPEISSIGKKLTLPGLALEPTAFQPVATLTPQLLPTQQEKYAATPTPKNEVKLTPTTEPPQEKESDPQFDELPPSASISGVKGSPQLYTLDCEAQTAVDWARFFGTQIGHLEFIDRLPRSDDPEEGFVGTINGPMGQLPPYDYGVHAPPVAALLREYDVPARALRGVDFEIIKKEIAAGRPVIAWIVNLPYDIITQEYTASNGNTTLVARYEHTWIITAYNMNVVTVVDSQWTYNVKISTFLERWNALGNQAIIYASE